MGGSAPDGCGDKKMSGSGVSSPGPLFLVHRSTGVIPIMPTVLRVGPYRLFFYAADGSEPAHVHVEHDACVAKFWLDPVRVATNTGFKPRALREIGDLVTDNRGDRQPGPAVGGME